MQKEGSVDWTVGKLLSIVLLIIVIVLVVWGITTGGLNPLIEKTGGKFDEVLILLNKLRGIDEPSDVDCIYENVDIDGVGQGLATFCKTECNISLNKPLDYFNSNKFKFKEGGIYSFTGSSWFDESNMIIDIEKTTLNRKIYSELKKRVLYEIFREEEINKDKLNSVLGFDEERLLRFKVLEEWGSPIFDWNGEKWEVDYGRSSGSKERFSSSKDLETGIREIYRYYIGDYKVTWGYIGEDEDNYKIPFTNTIGNSKNKAHVDEGRFSEWLKKKVEEWNSNYLFYKEEINKLIGEEKGISIDGEFYVFSLGKRYSQGVHYLPLIYIEILEDKKGIYYEDNKFYFYSEEDKEVENYNDYNFIITISNGIWEEIKKLNLVYDYLKVRC